MQTIPFNIWDDYCNDKTYGYVEEHDVLTDEQKEEIAKIITTYINKNFPEIETEDQGEDVGFPNLNHETRETLVENLQKSNLTWQNIPINFYSES